MIILEIDFKIYKCVSLLFHLSAIIPCKYMIECLLVHADDTTHTYN